ncbi:MAG: lipocalin family protein [Planctomycetota bacterium]|nr:lipocalin family protein [Planctomycetota bacterium]
MTDVTATYSLREDGKVKVVNRGYSEDKKKFKSAQAVAKLAGDENTGHLKVSFFPLFWADYKIVYLTDDYSVAIVTSNTYNYLWFLSREPKITDKLYDELEKRVAKMGFDLAKLSRVSQTRAKK